jgi:hypothetical protein
MRLQELEDKLRSIYESMPHNADDADEVVDLLREVESQRVREGDREIW